MSGDVDAVRGTHATYTYAACPGTGTHTHVTCYAYIALGRGRSHAHVWSTMRSRKNVKFSDPIGAYQ